MVQIITSKYLMAKSRAVLEPYVLDVPLNEMLELALPLDVLIDEYEVLPPLVQLPLEPPALMLVKKLERLRLMLPLADQVCVCAGI